MQPVQWGAGVAVLFFLGLAWVVTKILGVGGEYANYVFLALSTLGISATAIFFFYQQRFAARREEAAQNAAAGGGGGAAAPQGAVGASPEIDLLVRDAEARLSASPLAPGADLAGSPVIFLMGDTGSVKTTTLVHSGMEPELLAGQVYQENTIIPTRTANFWFAKKGVFVEASGRMMQDSGLWNRLLKKLQPGKLKSVFGRGGQAPRAAILCFDLERFLQPGATDAVASAARALHARLLDISQQFGISFPVYVLFTKTDRVPFFLEFVRNLGNEEATQVFGCTLPMRPAQSSGVYAEDEARRLTQYFNDLFSSLCDKRILYLPRENDPSKLPGAYEFPRELRKLRAPLVRFLTDIGRPSQLQTSHFLRGFYFSGVRPIIISDIGATPLVQPSQPAYHREFEATHAFARPRFEQPSVPTPQPHSQGSGKRVPQWVFLTHFFNDIVLEDHAALGASGASVKVSGMRRILMITGASLALLWALLLTISFFKNRGLEQDAIAKARDIPAATLPTGSLPALRDLQRLDGLREVLVQLRKWNREGAPLFYRWGLYTGDDLLPVTRRVYFEAFRKLLFNDTQSRLMLHLRGLTNEPTATDDYGYSYDALKAYLLTTSESRRASAADIQKFLGATLMARWSEKRSIDELRVLAQRQFDFYAAELGYDNPFSPDAEPVTVKTARVYLSKFGGEGRIYNNILTEANGKFKSVNFNRDVPGSSRVVINNRDVPGAFTKDGWNFFRDALKNLKKYYGGEEWVLDPKNYPTKAWNDTNLEKTLMSLFKDDFIRRWREYLRNGSVVRYANINDAAAKLPITSGNSSPLVHMFWLVTRNTQVDPATDEYAKQVRAAFGPIYKFNSDPGNMLAGGSNSYLTTLTDVSNAIASVAQMPQPDDAIVNQTIMVARMANGRVSELTRGFGPDPDGNLMSGAERLPHDPITEAIAVLEKGDNGPINAAGAAFCKAFDEVTRKFPFSSRAQQEVTLDELTRFLHPSTGQLKSLYDQFLSKSLIKSGPQYVPSPTSKLKLDPRFVDWFNKAMHFADTVWPNGSPAPNLSYTLQTVPSDLFQVTRLDIDGFGLNLTALVTGFKWTASPTGNVLLQGRQTGSAPTNYQTHPRPGVPGRTPMWSVFRFFSEANKMEPRDGKYLVTWAIMTGDPPQPATTPDGRPITYSFLVDSPIFTKEYLQAFRCVAKVAN